MPYQGDMLIPWRVVLNDVIWLQSCFCAIYHTSLTWSKAFSLGRTPLLNHQEKVTSAEVAINCPIDIFPAQKKKTHQPTTGRVWRNCQKHMHTTSFSDSRSFSAFIAWAIPSCWKRRYILLPYMLPFTLSFKYQLKQCTTNSLQTWKFAEM